MRSNSPNLKKSKYEKLVKMHQDVIDKKKKFDLNRDELEDRKRQYEELKAKIDQRNHAKVVLEAEKEKARQVEQKASEVEELRRYAFV